MSTLKTYMGTKMGPAAKLTFCNRPFCNIIHSGLP